MSARYRRQRRIRYWGLVLHGFSASRKKLLADPDTAPDVANNYRLDQKDADGDRSDGMEESWLRYEENPSPHNMKNIPREQIELLHPKTVARLHGRDLLMTHLGWAAGLILGLVAVVATR